MNEKRLKQLNIAKKLFFVTLLLYIAVFFLMNSPSLTGDNIGRFFFDIKSAVTEDIPEDGTVTFEESQKNTVSVFKNGLVILSQKTLSVYSRNNILMSEFNVNFTAPVLKRSDNYIVSFDRGDTTLCLSNSFDMLYTKTFSENIINAAVSDNGYVAVVTETYGYKARVTVLNDKLQEIYYWFSSKTNVIDVVFSTSNVISVIGIVPDMENIDTVIHRINFRTGEEQKTYTVTDAFPLAIKKKSDNSIELITDSGIYSVRNDGYRPIYQYINTDIDCYWQDEKHTVFSITENAASKLCQVEAISSTGDILFRKYYTDVKSVVCYYDVFLILAEDVLYVLDSSGTQLYATAVPASAGNICANRDALYVTGASFAKRIDISEAFS